MDWVIYYHYVRGSAVQKLAKSTVSILIVYTQAIKNMSLKTYNTILE